MLIHMKPIIEVQIGDDDRHFQVCLGSYGNATHMALWDVDQRRPYGTISVEPSKGNFGGYVVFLERRYQPIINALIKAGIIEDAPEIVKVNNVRYGVFRLLLTNEDVLDDRVSSKNAGTIR